jgi:hypothetical protein
MTEQSLAQLYQNEPAAKGAVADAVSFRNGVKMYQLDDTGAVVGVSITGAKYYKDDDLN